MALWCIENLDDAGEGMFIVNAKSKREALLIHNEKNPGMKITLCGRIKWVDLALVSGKLGESYYYERQRKKAD